MNFKTLNIDDLEFDKQNPRLPTTVGTEESAIIEYLATKTGIADLMISIGENGFFQGEAIVVTSAENGKYTVLEGNRRLVALKLLQNPRLASNRKSITGASEEAKNKPTDIPAFIVNSRYDALQYLGFRHISGVQRWDPLAKARYLKLLFEQASGEPEKRCIEVAREIGSRRDAVRRSLDALAAYEAIEERDFFDIDDLNEGSFRFGTFYTAIANAGIASFVGVRQGDSRAPHPIANPKSLKKEPLKELTEWMFKKDSQGSTRLGESRNIPKLNAVIENPDALKKLRQGASLDSAYSATIDNREVFLQDITLAIDHLEQAKDHLKQANLNLYSLSSDDQEADDQEAVESVQEAMNMLDDTINRLKNGHA